MVTDGMDSAHHYRGAAGESYHYGKRRLPGEAYEWVADLRREKFERFVGPETTVVEFGVGAGWNLARLDCARRIGVDVADFLADEVRSRGIEFVADSTELESGSADLVICHHMLEHVISPADVLGEIRRVLAPDGVLVLSVPHESQRRWRRYDRDEPNHHLFSWSVQSLGALVEETGLTVESAELATYGYDRAAGSLAARLRLGARGLRAIRALMHVVRPVREVRVVARPASIGG